MPPIGTTTMQSSGKGGSMTTTTTRRRGEAAAAVTPAEPNGNTVLTRDHVSKQNFIFQFVQSPHAHPHLIQPSLRAVATCFNVP